MRDAGSRSAGVAGTVRRDNRARYLGLTLGRGGFGAQAGPAGRRAGRRSIARARRGDGPTLIEAKVTRLTAHSSDDQQTKYRSEADLEEGRQHDPLPRFRGELRDAGVLTDEVEAAMGDEIKSAVEDATDWAEGEAEPDPATAERHVYFEPGAAAEGTADASTPAAPHA